MIIHGRTSTAYTDGIDIEILMLVLLFLYTAQLIKYLRNLCHIWGLGFYTFTISCTKKCISILTINTVTKKQQKFEEYIQFYAYIVVDSATFILRDSVIHMIFRFFG